MIAMYPQEDPHLSDAENLNLFARARGGDEVAWQELYRACYPKVIRAVRRKLNSRAIRTIYDSADFASDVWKSLAAKKDRYDFPNIEALVAFLKQEAMRKVSDGVRRMHTLKRDIDRQRPMGGIGDVEESPFDPASGDPTPSQFAQAVETHEQLVAGLIEQEREVIRLRNEGYSNEEIAERVEWHIRKVQRFLKDRHDTFMKDRLDPWIRSGPGECT